ncbi:hypothetical protein [Streptomyces sp. NPDC058964]|uniref:hypothetical protein n=1 Tax=Streptomyces sp. NPDC058964 TaxID=3346681 RepID=UPI0036C63A5B
MPGTKPPPSITAFLQVQVQVQVSAARTARGAFAVLAAGAGGVPASMRLTEKGVTAGRPPIRQGTARSGPAGG